MPMEKFARSFCCLLLSVVYRRGGERRDLQSNAEKRRKIEDDRTPRDMFKTSGHEALRGDALIDSDFDSS